MQGSQHQQNHRARGFNWYQRTEGTASDLGGRDVRGLRRMTHTTRGGKEVSQRPALAEASWLGRLRQLTDGSLKADRQTSYHQRQKSGHCTYKTQQLLLSSLHELRSPTSPKLPLTIRLNTYKPHLYRGLILGSD